MKIRERGLMKKMERLDKILSHMGLGSRNQIRSLVKQGEVFVNRKIIKDSGQKINPEVDLIEVHGERVIYRKHIYLMMNKPQGVISATEDRLHNTVIDLLSHKYKHFELFPVGRLDKDTVGLLLLTNDGGLAHDLLSPKKHVDKMYYAEVEGELTEEDVEQFKAGVRLDDGVMTLPAKLEILKSGVISKAEITIKEGKFHQIKRMFANQNKKVIFLQRKRMGSLELDESLALGTYRELTESELIKLRSLN